MMHFRETLRGTTLWSRLDFFVEEAKNTWLRELGKNDFLHSRSIELVLDRLVPDDIKTNQDLFDHGEVFLLLVSVYLHDIGRKQNNEQHEIESYQQIRENPSRFHLDVFEANAIAQICAAHAPESVWPINRCDPNYGIAGLTSSGRTFNLRRLGALLRIGDELDNAYVRVRGTSAEISSIRRLIRDINPQPTKGIIEIQAEPQTWEDAELLFNMREYTQRRLKEVQPYLKELHLDYYQIWLDLGEFKAPLSLPRPISAYEDLIETTASLLEPIYTSVDLLTKIEDCEISILCTQNNFGMITRTAVLVTPSLNKSQANEFVGALSYLQKERLISTGLVVVNTEPDSEVALILTGRGFHLKTLKDLLLGRYNFTPAMDRYIREYEQKEIFQHDLFVSTGASFESGEEAGEVLTYVEKWCNSPYGVQITLLGDFGSGKTTICERIAYEHAKAHKINPTSMRVPLLVSLKEIGRASSIEAVITNLLVNKLHIEISYKTFEALNKAGRFLLILDGFDEMSGLVDGDSVLTGFRMIDSLVEQHSKVILTCRTHFFKDTVQIHALHEGSPLYKSIDKKQGYELLFVNSFTQEQVNEYIEKWSPSDSERYKRPLHEIYNLADLAIRPVLLYMIVKTIPQLAIGNVDSLNASSLYEMYIRFWLERDDWRSQLDVYHRRSLAESVSNYMFVTGKYSIHYSEIPLLLKEWMKSETAYNMDILDYELRTCNFLKRDPFGYYKFAHKSFMEYLLAYLLCEQLFSGTQEISVQWFLPLEINSQDQGELIQPSAEIESFVLQIAQVKLSKLTWIALTNLIGARKRAAEIVCRIIEHLHLDGFGCFYATLLLDPKYKVDRKFLVQQTLNSDSLKNTVSSLIASIKSCSNINYLWDLFRLFSDYSNTNQQELLAELEHAIDKREEELYETESTSKKVSAYPYTRDKRNDKLREVLAPFTTPDKIYVERKIFYRNWYRDKHEYDQQVKINEDRDKKRQLKDSIPAPKKRERKKRKKNK
jgi:hypothetical protein